VKIWRKANNGDKRYSLYKISHKANCLIQQMYRIMLGEEDIPMSVRRNKVMKKESYSDKLDARAMKLVNKDKTR
jgi:arginyl-tRNA synthetase